VAKTMAAISLLAVALAIAGCGGNSSSGGYGGRSEPAKPASSGSSGTSGGAIVSVASVPELGRIVVDSKGFTLYDFHKDKGTTSACYGACAGLWPPLTTSGTPTASNGAVASKLGTTQRKDGSIQVTYAGHPLYTYAADTKPGEAKGNDFSSYGAEWYALQPNGEEPEG
jgi:predicted lipoprotein with Yx(FWY)xxD motif